MFSIETFDFALLSFLVTLFCLLLRILLNICLELSNPEFLVSARRKTTRNNGGVRIKRLTLLVSQPSILLSSHRKVSCTLDRVRSYYS